MARRWEGVKVGRDRWGEAKEKIQSGCAEGRAGPEQRQHTHSTTDGMGAEYEAKGWIEKGVRVD